MRASLLARAIARTLSCSRFLAVSSQGSSRDVPNSWLDQHAPCYLREKHAQVAIAALGYLAQDGSVSGRQSAGGPLPTRIDVRYLVVCWGQSGRVEFMRATPSDAVGKVCSWPSHNRPLAASLLPRFCQIKDGLFRQ